MIFKKNLIWDTFEEVALKILNIHFTLSVLAFFCSEFFFIDLTTLKNKVT